MPEPTGLNKWDENETNVETITAAFEDDGYPLQSKASSGIWNAWMRNTYKWTAWFKDKFIESADVGTIPDLRAITYIPEDGHIVVVSGVSIEGDGGGGKFRWNSSSIATDNTGIYVKVSAITVGRFVRLTDDSSKTYTKWFDVKADVTTDDTNAIQAAIDYVESLTVLYLHTLEFSEGYHKISGDPGIKFSKSLIVNCNGAVFYYYESDGTAIEVSAVAPAALGSFFLNDFQVVRIPSTPAVGIAASDFLGIGLLIENVKNFVINNPKIQSFGKGIYFYGNGQGTSYGAINAPVIITNLIGMDFDATVNPAAFCTEVKVFGGRIGFDTSTYNTLEKLAGTRLVRVNDTAFAEHEIDGLKFFGTNLENAVERKVELKGQAEFYGCYWDAGANEGSPTGANYKESATGFSSANGSPILTKVGHGLQLVSNDRITITTAGFDFGNYKVISSTVDTITIDKNLYDTSALVSLTAFRTDIYLNDNASGCVIHSGNNLRQQVIVDDGENNIIEDGKRGIGVGSANADPMKGIGNTDLRALMQLRGKFAGTVSTYFDNVIDNPSSAEFAQEYRTVDSYGRIRVGTKILSQKLGSDTRNVRHRMLFYNSIGGAYQMTDPQSFNFGLNYDNDGSTAIGQSNSAGSYRGILKKWIWAGDTVADEALMLLPAGSTGFITVSANSECGTFLVEDDRTVTKVSGTANTAATAAAGSLCVYDTGSAVAVRNRLGTVAKLRAEYNY